MACQIDFGCGGSARCGGDEIVLTCEDAAALVFWSELAFPHRPPALTFPVLQ
jgi:hypothetical protein